jgi:hypothetical protein
MANLKDILSQSLVTASETVAAKPSTPLAPGRIQRSRLQSSILDR